MKIGRAFAIWFGATTIGVMLIVFLPEGAGSGALFRLSDRHGPSVADSAGLAFVMAGWFIYIRTLWSQRANVRSHRIAAILVAVVAAAIMGCLFATTANEDWLIVVAAAIAIAAQIGLGVLVSSRP